MVHVKDLCNVGLSINEYRPSSWIVLTPSGSLVCLVRHLVPLCKQFGGVCRVQLLKHIGGPRTGTLPENFVKSVAAMCCSSNLNWAIIKLCNWSITPVCCITINPGIMTSPDSSLNQSEKSWQIHIELWNQQSGFGLSVFGQYLLNRSSYQRRWHAIGKTVANPVHIVYFYITIYWLYACILMLSAESITDKTHLWLQFWIDQLY